MLSDMIIYHLLLYNDSPSSHLLAQGPLCLLVMVEYHIALGLCGMVLSALSLARSRYSLTFPFALGTNTKLCYPLAVLSTPHGTILYSLCILPRCFF